MYILLVCLRVRPYRGAMTMQSANDTRWRGSREVWIDAAFESLIEAGIAAVRIQPLAAKLNLSRTSFYWFFKDREQLLESLLERWRAKNTGSLVRQTGAYAESIVEATLNVFDCWQALIEVVAAHAATQPGIHTNPSVG